ncbi:MAG: hypothetical protein NXI32_11630 [bacterium]|nr:hypothetical protein [bacterium]
MPGEKKTVILGTYPKTEKTSAYAEAANDFELRETAHISLHLLLESEPSPQTYVGLRLSYCL